MELQMLETIKRFLSISILPKIRISILESTFQVSYVYKVRGRKKWEMQVPISKMSKIKFA